MKKIHLYAALLVHILVSGCDTKKENFAGPQNLNHAVDLQEVGTTTEKIAGLDLLLQSFVYQKKVSSMVVLLPKVAMLCATKHLVGKILKTKFPLPLTTIMSSFHRHKLLLLFLSCPLLRKGWWMESWSLVNSMKLKTKL